MWDSAVSYYFPEFLRVRVCGHAASLPFCVSKGTRLGLDGYM